MTLSGVDRSEQEISAQFARLFEKHLRCMCKKLCVKLSDVYFARDCPRSEVWRFSLYADYKGKRDSSRQAFDPNIFPFTYATLLPMLCTKYGCKVIGCRRAEADDVIAVIKRSLRETHPLMTIHIVSNDRDYMQLLDNFTFMYDPNLKPILASCGSDVFLLMKIIGGDPSDNIRPISANIGPKCARKLADRPDLLDALLQSSEDIRGNFERNDMLINLTKTPADIITAVLKDLRSRQENEH